MLKTYARRRGRRTLQQELQEERRLGYRLRLVNEPAGFINGLMLADMTKTFHKAGIDCGGLNYFTLGDIKHNLSSRFTAGSNFYQAWLGGYLIDCDHSLWTIEEDVALSKADQERWLWHFGDPSPVMTFQELQLLGDITVSGYKAKLCYWSGNTHSDVGPRNQRLYTKLIMEGMAAIINSLNPGLRLTGSQFIPPKSKTEYPAVRIHGYHATVEMEHNRTMVMYVCATDKINGTKLKKYFSNLKIEKL